MRTTLATTALVSLCLVGAPSLARSQSLAEVAAKERERREAEARKPATVITEDELARGRRGAAPPDEVAPTSESSESSGSTASGEGQGTEEKSEEELRAEARTEWEKRQKAAEDKVAQLTAQLDELQQSLGDMRVYQLGPNRAKALERRDQLTADLETAKQALEDLEEERRRAGY